MKALPHPSSGTEFSRTAQPSTSYMRLAVCVGLAEGEDAGDAATDDATVTAMELRGLLSSSLRATYGQVGSAAIQVSILQCSGVKSDKVSREFAGEGFRVSAVALLAVPSEGVVPLRAALTMVTSLDSSSSGSGSRPCRVHVTQVGGSLMSMACPRR